MHLSTQIEADKMRNDFSRKGAKAQRKTQRNLSFPFALFFAPLRLCGRNFCPGFDRKNQIDWFRSLLYDHPQIPDTGEEQPMQALKMDVTLNDEQLWQAVVSKDARFDGQ